MTDRFLMRPAPLQGESLSSWRQRCAWANGYRLFPMHDQRSRRIDPDIGLREDDMRWLAQSHDLPESEVQALSFRGLVGDVVTGIRSRQPAAWWLPARYGKQRASVGAMFCPMCLTLDATPYYRLAWRLAFNYSCSEHEVLLQESCEMCGAPPWPAGCGVADRICAGFTSFGVCWSCGGAHRTATQTRTLQVVLPDIWMKVGRVQMGSRSVPSVEAFAALRALCQLFVRKDTRALLLASPGPWAEAVQSFVEGTEVRSIELASVRVRAKVVPAAIELLADWPHKFVDTARRVGITRTHFNASYHLQPAWFNDCLQQNLARQNRWVTTDLVRAVAEEIRKAGRPVTKVAIRKKLMWQGDIDDRLLGH